MRSQIYNTCDSTSFALVSVLDSYRVLSGNGGVGMQRTILRLNSTCSRLKGTKLEPLKPLQILSLVIALL